jgi:hypothetical protein
MGNNVHDYVFNLIIVEGNTCAKHLSQLRGEDVSKLGKNT